MIFALVLLILFHHSFCLEDTANTCPKDEYCQTSTRIGALGKKIGNIVDSLISVGLSTGCPICRSGYEYYMQDKFCYKFYVDYKTWSEARQVCQQEGGDLISLNDRNLNFFRELARAKEEEKTCVILAISPSDGVKHVKNLGIGTCNNVWVGTTDVSLEGQWNWLNGDKINSAFWAPGQPDNWGSIENCGDLSKKFDYRLNDEDCNKTQQFICQADY